MRNRLRTLSRYALTMTLIAIVGLTAACDEPSDSWCDENPSSSGCNGEPLRQCPQSPDPESLPGDGCE